MRTFLPAFIFMWQCLLRFSSSIFSFGKDHIALSRLNVSGGCRGSVIIQSLALILDTHTGSLLAAKTVAISRVTVSSICRDLKPFDRLGIIFVDADTMTETPAVAVCRINVSVFCRTFIAPCRITVILFKKILAVKE